VPTVFRFHLACLLSGACLLVGLSASQACENTKASSLTPPLSSDQPGAHAKAWAVVAAHLQPADRVGRPNATAGTNLLAEAESRRSLLAAGLSEQDYNGFAAATTSSPLMRAQVESLLRGSSSQLSAVPAERK
jgi:hypothetical protein